MESLSKDPWNIQELRKAYIWTAIIGSMISLCLFSIACTFIVENTFSIFCIKISELSKWSQSSKESVLLLFPAILATITAFIFAVSGINDTKKIPINQRKTIIGYSLWLLPNIVFPLLLFGNVEIIPPWLFRFSIVLFTVNLISMIPYFIVYIHSNSYSILRLSYALCMKIFIIRRKRYKEKHYGKLDHGIITISNLLIQTISENDYITFRSGLKRVKQLAITILKAPKCFPDDRKNHLLKRIISTHEPLALKLIDSKSIFSFKDLLKYLKEHIERAMEYERSKSEKNILQIDIMAQALIKIGFLCVENNLAQEDISEVIDSLGRIGKDSVNPKIGNKLVNAPGVEVLNGLHTIGILCAQKRFENQCLNCLSQMQSIADKAKSTDKIVYERALKSYWILAAHSFEYIPELKKMLKDASKRMVNEFGKDYLKAFAKAEEDMDNHSSIGLAILSDYKKVNRHWVLGK